MYGRRQWFVFFATALFALSAVAAKPPAILSTIELGTGAPVALDLASGSKLEVKGVRGEIQIVRGEGPQTIVTIEPAEGGDQPKLQMLRLAEGVTICTVYPSPNPKKPNECLPGKQGRMLQGKPKTWPAVKFTVELPDGVDFMGNIEEGAIVARAGKNNLDLKSMLGNITISDGGSQVIQANVAWEGTIKAEISPASLLPEVRTIKLETMSGTVDVTIPSTIPIRYTVTADKPVRSDMKLEDPLHNMRHGALGPEGPPALRLILDGSTLGTLIIRKPKS